jgi:uncharacterized tellurite resistance protein B-like protein
MHFILGILGTAVTLVILYKSLQDAGFDIGWLNPFSWARRRAFRKQYLMHPAYTLESSMDVAALFMVAVAKVDGDMSKEQKNTILNLFATKFSLAEKQASSLLNSSVHIYGTGQDVFDNPSKVLARTIDSFTPEQVNSVIEMLQEVARVEQTPTIQQQKLIARITKAFPTKNLSQW